MPDKLGYQVKVKIEVIILLVGTLFQTAKTTFLPRKDWITVYDRVKQLLVLTQTPEFMTSLKQAHAPVEESKAVEDDEKNTE